MKLNFRFGILKLRGGLGNQLFQLSALAYYCKKLNFIPIIFDADLYLSQRDTYYPQYKKVYLSEWFENGKLPKVLPKSLNRISSFVFLRVLKLRNLGESVLATTSKVSELPYFFIIRDTFENDLYFNSLSKEALNSTLESLHEMIKLKENSVVVAIHIRISGYPKLTEAQLQNLGDCIMKLHGQGHRFIDVYSDNIESLDYLSQYKELVSFNFPERNNQFDAVRLLHTLSDYDMLICNGSSLARWSNCLAMLRSKQVFVRL